MVPITQLSRWPLVLLFLLGLSLVQARDRDEGVNVARTEFDAIIHTSITQYFEHSDVVLLATYEDFGKSLKAIWRSEDAGQSWKEVEELEEAAQLILHPYDNKVAFVLTQGRKYWVTHNRGKHWKSHELPEGVQPVFAGFGVEPLIFHAGGEPRDNKKVILNAIHGGDNIVQQRAYYSTDGFEKPNHLQELRKDTRGCSWANSKREFKGLEGKDAQDRILCLAKGKFQNFRHTQRLLVSDDFFQSDEREPVMASGRTLQGISDIAHVKGYIVAAARAENTRELALFVSLDGLTWHRAEFEMDHRILERSYVILESTEYSLQVAVTTSKDQSVLMISNSNGTYFTKSKEAINHKAFVDFEKVMGFQGIILVNTVDDEKKIHSLISFQDGKGEKAWQSLKTEDDQNLHLHSVTERRYPGRIYSSSAPGVLMGVGNVGESLLEKDDGDLFVSNDAGHTWRIAREGPHKYGFGDEGNVLLAVPDKNTKVAYYSLNHGKDWKEFVLDADQDVTVKTIVMTPDSSSRTFLLVATVRTGDRDVYTTYSVATDHLLHETCKKHDLEEIKSPLDRKPCIMGHRQIYERRKADAECFVRSKSRKEKLRTEPCACSKEYDFECDYNYISDSGKCVPARKLTDKCNNPDDEYEDASGFRLIPGNECSREGGDSPDKETEMRSCANSTPEPPSGNITTKAHEFDAEFVISQITYLERTRTSRGDDETVIVLMKHRSDRKSRSQLWLSSDHGKTWEHILKKEDVQQVVRHDYDNDAVFFITSEQTVFYSYDRAKVKSIHKFEVETHYNNNRRAPQPLSFHHDDHDVFIWTGSERSNCEPGSKDCTLNSHFTEDRGKTWQVLKKAVGSCEFVKPREGMSSEESAARTIFCSTYKNNRPGDDLELRRSDDFFEEHDEMLFDNIFLFQSMSEYTVSASMDSDNLLYINSSLAGGDFAPAKFPPKFNTKHETFTILQSSTHALLVYAAINDEEQAEHGRILKSNSNGTYFVTSLDLANSDSDGFVDFETVQGIEGVSLANIVFNPEDLKEGKRLQSRITHNDGADWAPLPIPNHAKDSEGINYDCYRSRSECLLHLYGYTVKQSGQSYSSSSAVGLLIGNGNVGLYLDASGKKDATFVSRDAGISWDEVAKGKHLWAFGDQGSIVALVKSPEETDTLLYSLSDDRPKAKHQFTDSPVQVLDFTTVPSDNSKSFIIWARKGEQIISFNVDFSGLRGRDCKFEEGSEDYVIWRPRHPFQKENNECLFGHILQYYRKNPEKDCWNGPLLESHGLHEISQKCPCIRADFECDFNYEKATNGECVLVPGFAPPDHSLQCKENSSLARYFEPTGYRHIPLDDCEGGQDLAYLRMRDRPCPGHEEEFERLHGQLSGFAFFLVAIALPIGVATGIGYWVYSKWDGKFGAIRLGESPADTVFDVDKPWVRYPVIVVSALVAVAMAVPGGAVSAWRRLSSIVGRSRGRYTSRASFTRDRGEYTAVDDYEDELLGEEDEDEL